MTVIMTDRADKILTVPEVIELLGRAEIADACGVTIHSVRACIAKEAFPASWYDVVRAMCVRASVECTLDMFSFKEVPEVLKTIEVSPPKDGEAA